MQPNQRILFTLGIYICPFSSVGCLTVTRGQKFKFMASLMSVYEPLISACDAMILAAEAILCLK